MTRPLSGFVPVAAATLLAALLRLYGLTRQGFWTDELYVAWEARQPLEAIFDPRIHIHHPPGYRLVLHVWAGVSTEEWWLRLLPALAGVALVPVIGALARELWPAREWAAASAALFAATSPFLVHYGQDVTAYSWTALWVSLSFLLLLKAWRRNTPLLWAGWSLSLAVSAYSHYFAIFPLAAQGVALAVALVLERRRTMDEGRGHSRVRLHRAALAIGGALLLFAPWAVRLFTGVGSSLRQVLYPPGIDEQPLGWLPVLLAGYPEADFWLSNPSKLLVWALLAAALLWGAWRLWQRRAWKDAGGVALLLAWGIAATAGPYLFLRMTTPPGGVTPVRFAAMAVPALVLLAAALASALPRLGRVLLIAGWLAMSGAQLYAEYSAPPTQDWRGIMGVVARNSQPGDAMLAFTAFHAGAAAAYYTIPVPPQGGWLADERGEMGASAYWLPVGWRWQGFFDTAAYRSADFEGEITARTGGATRIWYLAGDGRDGTYPPGPRAERALLDLGWVPSGEWRASPLVLKLYARSGE